MANLVTATTGACALRSANSMGLTRSTWKRKSMGNPYDVYIQILPEEGFIVTYTSMRPNEVKFVIWGLWIREEPGSIAYTAIKNAKTWHRESYKIQGHQLIWSIGHCDGDSIDDSSIPVHLEERGASFIAKHASLNPPEFNLANQVAPSNRW